MKKKQTIFNNDKPLADVLIEGVLFALGTVTALLIAGALILILTNLIQ